jgi:hypothetical protein
MATTRRQEAAWRCEQSRAGPGRAGPSDAAHVDEIHLAELDAHIRSIHHERALHAKVEHRSGRRMTRASQHKAQPRREGGKLRFTERHRAGRQRHLQRVVAEAHESTVEPGDQAVVHCSVRDMLRHTRRRMGWHPCVTDIRWGWCRRQSRCWCRRQSQC